MHGLLGVSVDKGGPGHKIAPNIIRAIVHYYEHPELERTGDRPAADAMTIPFKTFLPLGC